jgi:hypothetical protein
VFTISRLAGTKSYSMETSGLVDKFLFFKPFMVFHSGSNFHKGNVKKAGKLIRSNFLVGMISHPGSSCLIKAFLKRSTEGDMQGLHSV